MGWNNDTHGLVFKSNEIKLFANGQHTWNMKLSQLARTKGTVRIVTYSLPEIEYVTDLFSKRPEDIYLVCHTKFEDKATIIKRMFPLISIAVNAEVHSKVCLISPSTVYVGSANFGRSHWHETIVGIRSSDAHDWYLHHSFFPLWDKSTKVN